jgi:glycosyltransferase involved in cell wall biosynthesis
MVEGVSSILAVVPAYNEAGTVADVVRSLREHVPGLAVVVVDDGSTDDTAVNAMAAGAPVIRLPYNLGIGGAVQTGFQYALDHGYGYMVQVDGDGQHEAPELAKLVAAMRADPDVDVVCGSRFLTQEQRYQAPIGRRTGVRLFALALRLVIKSRVSDPTSGFRLYNRRAIAMFAREYPQDYPEVEAVLMMHHHRLKMIEVPVSMQLRRDGKSSITPMRSPYYVIKVSLALLVGLLRRSPVEEPTVASRWAAPRDI